MASEAAPYDQGLGAATANAFCAGARETNDLLVAASASDASAASDDAAASDASAANDASVASDVEVASDAWVVSASVLGRDRSALFASSCLRPNHR